MPTVIIAGTPPDIERRVQAALKQGAVFPGAWQIIWLRSKGRTPGLAPSQLEDARHAAASHPGGSHFLVFPGSNDKEVVEKVAPHFRLRWLPLNMLKLIPHRMSDYFASINGVLDEEAKWIDSVKPRDESSCLLLPECAFSAQNSVRHIWSAAAQQGLERITLAAVACERFKAIHWLHNPKDKSRPRVWIDAEGRIFNHRGERHGVAPFLRPWKFSYQVVEGFHYDVESRNSRRFNLADADGDRHSASGSGHINIDPHGHVRM